MHLKLHSDSVAAARLAASRLLKAAAIPDSAISELDAGVRASSYGSATAMSRLVAAATFHFNFIINLNIHYYEK
jgi:hypothetical protein